jgi:PAS domain S-box-containing protein
MLALLTYIGKYTQNIKIIQIHLKTKEVSDARFNAISEISPDGIMTANFFGIITYVNPSFCTLTGYAYEDFVGKHMIQIPTLKQQDMGPFLNILKDIVAGKITTTSITFPYHRKDGTSGIGDAYASTLKVKNKRELIAIVKDITKQVELEKEREQYTTNLEHMVEEKTNQILDNEKMVTIAKVSSMIAHDLKGPLQTINNSVFLLKRNPENVLKYADFIELAVKQANELIDEFNTRGKRTPLKLEPVDLKKLVEESLLQVKTSENVIFSSEIKVSNKIMMDRSRILRVLNNLVKNAVEAMPNGGRLKLIGESVENQIILKVTDTGNGIPESRIDDIFRPFQSTKDKGMGLGLPYCKDTMEQHGGSISVSSVVGKGTTFTLSFPDQPETNPNITMTQIKTPEK